MGEHNRQSHREDDIPTSLNCVVLGERHDDDDDDDDDVGVSIGSSRLGSTIEGRKRSKVT